MAPGGNAKWLDVSAERFPGWVASFARRHGDSGSHGDSASLAAAPAAEAAVAFTAADGAVAECHPPFPESFALPPGLAGPDEPANPGEIAALLAAHARAPRTVGVLLVRLGGYAAGVFTGYPPALTDSKVGSRLVHGRSAAGGWSQQRFARRRENQAATALRAAADAAAEVFGRYGPDGLDAVVLGGDKRSAAGLADDARLEKYLAKATGRFLTVPDPRLAVLRDIPRAFLATRIRLTEPESISPVTG